MSRPTNESVRLTFNKTYALLRALTYAPECSVVLEHSTLDSNISGSQYPLLSWESLEMAIIAFPADE